MTGEWKAPDWLEPFGISGFNDPQQRMWDVLCQLAKDRAPIIMQDGKLMYLFAVSVPTSYRRLTPKVDRRRPLPEGMIKVRVSKNAGAILRATVDDIIDIDPSYFR